MRQREGFQPGGTRIGFLDALTVLILLGLLAYVSYLQFPTYGASAPRKSGAAQSSHRIA